MQRVPAPETTSPAEVEQLRRDLAGAQEALDEIEAENTKLKRDIEAVSKLKDADEVAVARLPEDEHERFNALVKSVRATLRPLDDIVVDAIWSWRFGSGLQRPPWHEQARAEEADKNLDAGFLQEGEEGALYPDSQAGPVERAKEQVERLQTFLTEECSPEFAEWFKRECDFEPDLRFGRVV